MASMTMWMEERGIDPAQSTAVVERLFRITGYGHATADG